MRRSLDYSSCSKRHTTGLKKRIILLVSALSPHAHTFPREFKRIIIRLTEQLRFKLPTIEFIRIKYESAVVAIRSQIKRNIKQINKIKPAE